MLNDYHISSLRQVWLALLLSICVSIVYWLASKANKKYERVIISSHGILLFLAFIYAVGISGVTSPANWRALILPFWGLLILSLISVVCTFLKYKGNKAMHLMQILVFPSAFFIWLIGTMTITHDWM